MPHNHGFQHRFVIKGKLILPQNGNALMGVGRNITASCFKLSSNYLQQRRFARAIGAN